MNYETLIDGYKQILNTIYAPKQYYERITTFLKEYKPRPVHSVSLSKLRLYHITAFFRAMWVLGVMENGRTRFWRFFISTLIKRPKLFPLSVSLSVYGIHFRRVVKKFGQTPTLKLPSPIKVSSDLTDTQSP